MGTLVYNSLHFMLYGVFKPSFNGGTEDIGGVEVTWIETKSRP